MTIHDSDNESSQPAPGPLNDIRALDISTVYAAPITAMLLGDYGAPRRPQDRGAYWMVTCSVYSYIVILGATVHICRPYCAITVRAGGSVRSSNVTGAAGPDTLTGRFVLPCLVVDARAQPRG
jgi:hypothetical protein